MNRHFILKRDHSQVAAFKLGNLAPEAMADAPRAVIMGRLRDLLALRNVRVQNADLVAQALRWSAEGMDLADALHLVLSGKAGRFITFDEALVKQARKLGVQPRVAAP